jgi:hypothetical protein
MKTHLRMLALLAAGALMLVSAAPASTAAGKQHVTARVRYSVSATDATDGLVPAACLPKSGSAFRVGRTSVTCTAVDSSGNTATSRFVITVKRVRR